MTVQPPKGAFDLTEAELAEVKVAVLALIDVLPEGDDMRGQARALLVSASEKIEHWEPSS